MSKDKSFQNSGTILKDIHSPRGKYIRTKDSLSVVTDHFDTFDVTYSGNNPTRVQYFLGTVPHRTSIGFVNDVNSSLAGTYTLISEGRNEARYALYITVNGVGNPPSIPNVINKEVAIQENDVASTIALAHNIVLDGLNSFEITRTVGVLEINTIKLGLTSNTMTNGTGFVINNTQGERSLVEDVNIIYSEDGFPIWQGQELKNYQYDIFSGAFLEKSEKYALESVDTKFDVNLSTRSTEATQLENKTELQNINTELDAQTTELQLINTQLNSGTTKIDYNEVSAVGLDTVTIIDKTISAGLEVMASKVSFSGENRSIATIQINNEDIAKLRIYYANYNSAIDLDSFKLVSGDNIKIIVENKTNSNALFNVSLIYSEITT